MTDLDAVIGELETLASYLADHGANAVPVAVNDLRRIAARLREARSSYKTPPTVDVSDVI